VANGELRAHFISAAYRSAPKVGIEIPICESHRRVFVRVKIVAGLLLFLLWAIPALAEQVAGAESEFP
jgi:hypothetical protein